MSGWIRILGVLGLVLACSGFVGCGRSQPPPPKMTDEVKTAIKSEDQKVFEAERGQR